MVAWIQPGAGRYAMTVSPDNYRFCVQSAALYLDPCQWGGTISQSVGAGVATVVPLRLTPGARFILRVHDTQRILPQVESGTRAGIAASLTDAATRRFPLPIVYDNGRIRDFGAVVPLNQPLRVVAAGGRINLADQAGAVLSELGLAFQIKPEDFLVLAPLAARLSPMFRAPDAKMVHIWITGRK